MRLRLSSIFVFVTHVNFFFLVLVVFDNYGILESAVEYNLSTVYVSTKYVPCFSTYLPSDLTVFIAVNLRVKIIPVFHNCCTFSLTALPFPLAISLEYHQL